MNAVIWNVQCYAKFTDFSKIKQLQPNQRQRQSTSTASHAPKHRQIAILR